MSIQKVSVIHMMYVIGVHIFVHFIVNNALIGVDIPM